jgi:hypothetical protein
MALLRLRSCSSRGRTRYPKRRERGNRGCPRLSPLRTSDAPTLAFPTRAARGSVGDRGDRGRGRDRCVACRSPTRAPASRASPTRRLRATLRSSPIPPCLSERACEIAQERARRSLAHSRGSSRGGYAANADAALLLSPKSTRRLVPTPMSEINGNEACAAARPDDASPQRTGATDASSKTAGARHARGERLRYGFSGCDDGGVLNGWNH